MADENPDYIGDLDPDQPGQSNYHGYDYERWQDIKRAITQTFVNFTERLFTFRTDYQRYDQGLLAECEVFVVRPKGSFATGKPPAIVIDASNVWEGVQGADSMYLAFTTDGEGAADAWIRFASDGQIWIKDSQNSETSLSQLKS